MSGTGWTCTSLTCTRTDGLQSGATYPYITVTVNVASTAPTSVSCKATLTVGSGSPIAFTDTNSTQQKLAPPTFTPPAGTYNTTQNVTLQAAAGASIRYQTSPDGVTWGAWQPYTLPIPVTSAMTIQAIASETGMADSAPAVAAYTLQFLLTTTVVPPGAGSVTINPSGPYAPGTAVTITATASGGYSFLAFTGDLNATANPQTITTNGSKSIAANFAPPGPGTAPSTLITNTTPQLPHYGPAVPFQLTFNSITTGGAADIMSAQAYIAKTPIAGAADYPPLPGSVPVCNFGYYYFKNSAKVGIYLVDYSNTGAPTYTGLIFSGDSGPVNGTYCSISNFSAPLPSGSQVSFTVNVAFSATFGNDQKTIWSYAASFDTSVYSAWTDVGTWDAFEPPAPNITLSMPSGPVQMGLQVQGSGFGTPTGPGTALPGTVTLGGQPMTVVSWTDTIIIVQVPPGAKSGPIVVNVGGASTNGAQFTVTTPFGCTVQ